MIDVEATLAALVEDLVRLESEISRLRLRRAELTYELARAVKEHDRLSRHVAAATRGEGAV